MRLRGRARDRSTGYDAPFRANVEIDRVVVDVSGDPHRDPAAEYDKIMSEQ